MKTDGSRWRSVVLAVALLVTACVAASGKVAEQDAPDDKAIRAFAMAYRDFSGSLVDAVGTKGDPELLAFFSRTDNYEVEFVETPSYYQITFAPVLYHGRMLNGGGAQYTVSKTTGELQLVERYE